MEGTGAELRGKAGIFGGSINPLQVYLQNQANRQRNQALYMQEERKKRDALISDLDKHSPDKVWDPFYGQINQQVQQAKDYTMKALESGMPAERVRRDSSRIFGTINTNVARANMLKDVYDKAREELKNNKHLYKPDAQSALNDIFFDGTNARNMATINPEDVRKNVFENPDLMNENAIALDFMKSLPEQVTKYYTEMWEPYGKVFQNHEVMNKLGVVTRRNAQTGQEEVVMDERTGRPKISMTPDVYIQATMNPFMQKILDKYVPNGSTEQKKQFLTQLLEGYDPMKNNTSLQLGFKTPEKDVRNKYFGGYGYTVPLVDLQSRDELLSRAVSGQGGDVLNYFTEVAKDIKASYSKDGKSITVTYPSLNPEFKEKSDAELESMSTAQKIAYYQSRDASRQIKERTLPIGTDQEKRAAKIALSQYMDEIDRKRSQGEEYPRFVEESRKKAEKKLTSKVGNSLNASLRINNNSPKK